MTALADTRVALANESLACKPLQLVSGIFVIMISHSLVIIPFRGMQSQLFLDGKQRCEKHGATTCHAVISTTESTSAHIF